MDSGVIASMLQHPLTSAVVLLDAHGQPLAANRVAQSLGLPATLGAYVEVLESSRAQVASSGGMTACVLPGPAAGAWKAGSARSAMSMARSWPSP